MKKNTRQKMLSDVKTFEGVAGKIPDKFAEMTLGDLIAEQNTISSSMEDLSAKISVLPKFKKKKGWFS